MTHAICSFDSTDVICSVMLRRCRVRGPYMDLSVGRMPIPFFISSALHLAGVSDRHGPACVFSFWSVRYRRPQGCSAHLWLVGARLKTWSCASQMACLSPILVASSLMSATFCVCTLSMWSSKMLIPSNVYRPLPLLS